MTASTLRPGVDDSSLLITEMLLTAAPSPQRLCPNPQSGLQLKPPAHQCN